MTEPTTDQPADLEDSLSPEYEMLERDPGPVPARAAEPAVLHTGTYALFLTPAGGLHVTFRKAMEQDAAGVLQPIAQPVDENLPEIPPAVFRLLAESAESGKRPSPMGLLRALMAAGGGDVDQAEEEALADGSL